MKKTVKSVLTSCAIVMTLFVSSVCVNAATYESVSFWTGTYMSGTINTSQTYDISGSTYLNGDPGTTYVFVKGVPYAGTGYTVTNSAYGYSTATTTKHSRYSLKEYYGTHTATVASTTKTVGTWYSK